MGADIDWNVVAGTFGLAFGKKFSQFLNKYPKTVLEPET
jgi:hypothetical protein